MENLRTIWITLMFLFLGNLYSQQQLGPVISGENAGDYFGENTAINVDGDLAQFEAYLDENDATTIIKTIAYQTEEESIEIDVENGSTYYWKIIAIDTNQNQSSSGVYAFRTN